MGQHRPTELRQYDDGIDMWSMADARPAAILAGLVDGYTAYEERTATFTARRELAATCGVLLYALAEPLSITGADGIEIVLKPGEAFAGGIAASTSISRALGAQRGVHIHLPLHALAAVCGTPIAELANRVVPFADLIGQDANDLGQRLGAADAQEQFDLLDDFLIRRFSDMTTPDRAVRWAMERLAAEDAPGVSEIASEIGWSRKHLGQRFAAVTGFSPQTFRRLARFERFATAIMERPNESLAILALDAGYHDQPHMSREVQAFGAMSPGELRRRLLPEQGGVREN
jgi:AraC-like DNA-binding protein